MGCGGTAAELFPVARPDAGAKPLVGFRPSRIGPANRGRVGRFVLGFGVRETGIRARCRVTRASCLIRFHCVSARKGTGSVACRVALSSGSHVLPNPVLLRRQGENLWARSLFYSWARSRAGARGWNHTLAHVHTHERTHVRAHCWCLLRQHQRARAHTRTHTHEHTHARMHVRAHCWCWLRAHTHTP